MNKHTTADIDYDVNENLLNQANLDETDDTIDLNDIDVGYNHSSKRYRNMNNYVVKKKIEAREEARRLRDLYDDWN